MIGIYLGNSKNCSIINCTFIDCDIGIHAENSESLIISGLNVQNCHKGIILDNCWDSDINNINHQRTITFKEKLLSTIIRNFMY